MKADFEKGTKVCSRRKKELPLNMFGKKKSSNDNLCPYCKQCQKEYSRKMQDKIGNTGKLKRDYELTDEQLIRREYNRKKEKSQESERIWCSCMV